MQSATLLIITLAVSVANADICTRCKCPTTQPTQIVDCSLLGYDKIPSATEWPTAVTNLTSNSLTILDFEHNDIGFVDQFPKLPSVVCLILRHNVINDLAEGVFLNLANLKKLDLSHNALSGDAVRADVFRGTFDNVRYEPLSIETLDLGYNRLQSLSSNAFEHLPDLTELHLNNNPLKIIDASTKDALASPIAIEILNLGYTELSTLSDELMHTMIGLRELYLHGNKFEIIPESLAAVGTSLERLNLNDNTMASLDENSFLGLDTLKELNISGCANLTAIRPATFAQLASLETLHLSLNFKLSYLDQDAFRELKDHWPIKEVYLKHNALSELSEDLLPWDELDVLDLQENPWTCDCHHKWMVQELLPKLRKKNPEQIQELRCKEPAWLRGRQMLLVNADDMDNTTSCTASVPRDLHVMVYPLHMFVVVIIALTIVVFSLSLIVLLKREVWRKRRDYASRNVRYMRHEDEEVFSI